jgi:hypothetical protein
MKNKYLSYLLIIIIVIMSGYIVVLKNKAVESSKLLSQVNLQKEQINEIKDKEAVESSKFLSQVNLQNQQLEEIKNRELGVRNMIPQYMSDINSILDEASSVLPVLKFKTKTNEEQKLLGNAKEWLLGQEGKKALKNKVVLSLLPNGLGDNNLFIIDALTYEKPIISTNEMPTPIGKAYIQYAQFRMKQENGEWKVAEFVDHF